MPSMKILFTGASSFTGMWFVKELVDRGHRVSAIFTKKRDEYDGIRKERVEFLQNLCTSHFSCVFGSQDFLDLVNAKSWELVCHHAADVTQYKSEDFNVVSALQNNTFHLAKVFRCLKARGCQKILLTGSVFEQNEGKGDCIDQAVSPYGLSKGLTAEVFRYYCRLYQLALGKFVIPNPFGPFEEDRYTTYLAKSWLKGVVPTVLFPEYVRDNIHVSLLAKAYAHALESMTADTPFIKWNPSGYREKQRDFTKRFAKEMQRRLGVACDFNVNAQNEFSEPRIRVNTDPFDANQWSWKEEIAWDQLAAFYLKHFSLHKSVSL